MAKINDAVAIGIGPQDDQTTVNPNVLQSTDLVTTAISTVDSGAPFNATGILLRNPEDLAKEMERVESEGGLAPGGLSRLPGGFIRINPTVSFTIDAMGNRDPLPAAPIGGEYNYTEYFEQILEGVRLVRGTEDPTFTTYGFAPDDSSAYKTVKIWRGTGADTESWTLVGCTFNLTLNYTPGEKATIDVEVVSSEVIHDPNVTFPPADLTTAYGNQIGASPILELAANSLTGTTRGWSTASLTIGYEDNEIQDCNATGGTLNSQSTRSVVFAGDYYADTLQGAGASDFELLEADLQDGISGPAATFTLGTPAVAENDIINAMAFTLPSFRMTNTGKVDGSGKVQRTLTGYGAVTGAAGNDKDQEFTFDAV